MPASEARILANRANAARSTGPRTVEGKQISRRNSLKHGMAGSGVVVPASDSSKIAARVEELRAEMAPRTSMGVALLVQLATLSVRVEGCFRQQSAASDFRARHAVDAFDDEQYDEAEALLGAIAENPAKALRKLKRTPEGVEALIDSWEELRSALTRDDASAWSSAHRERAENLSGRKLERADRSRIHALSKALDGDFSLLEGAEGGDLDPDARRAWARSSLVGLIDSEIDRLERHYETLDFDAIDADRAEAPDRARFDPSKEATLARRYESEALRNFHKALKEFRRVEAEAEAIAEPIPPARPVEPLGSSREMAGALGSSRQTPPSPPSDPIPAPRIAPKSDPSPAVGPIFEPDDFARSADGRVLAVGCRV